MENALTMTTLGSLRKPAETEEASRSAFAEIVTAHASLMHKIALSVTRNSDDAEDIVQEAFLQLYRTTGWPQIADHRAYLARVTWRIAIRHRPKPAGELPFNLPANSAGPEQEVIHRQAESTLHELIDRLPEKLRQPLVLMAIEELTSPEVAAILGIPEGTVRRRVHTAREQLRRQWENSTHSTRKERAHDSVARKLRPSAR
ncbi:RNA polymerase sigma factor [Acidicapsa dinghuensis]|uniref:RNA polymerase sigma factor n=1 Tax=Acidicapsa dinghuensis TaxID=2218256 RepID=A0ABW1EEI2_9BACT|nr:sigma-70 family RNA polymerase sigma factor [Acidicapsa dinghuensis]